MKRCSVQFSSVQFRLSVIVLVARPRLDAASAGCDCISCRDELEWQILGEATEAAKDGLHPLRHGVDHVIAEIEDPGLVIG
jgi:hypothetical protein